MLRDDVRYGVEVKNQLGYIDQTEFQIKLAMCVHFGIRPMFVTRAMPKNYIYDVMRAGGFSLLTDNQNYPLLADDLARRVRSTLNLPVGVIQQFPVTALDHLYVNPAGSPRKRVASLAQVAKIKGSSTAIDISCGMRSKGKLEVGRD